MDEKLVLTINTSDRGTDSFYNNSRGKIEHRIKDNVLSVWRTGEVYVHYPLYNVVSYKVYD